MSNVRIFEKKQMILVACVAAVCLTFVDPQSAHAGYLDPGSGSTAVQWIIAGIAGAGRFKRRIVDTVSRIFKR
ncbi:MAG: hypothetical protein OCC46_15515 [Pseudodesulfovibrio sp.]